MAAKRGGGQHKDLLEQKVNDLSPGLESVYQLSRSSLDNVSLSVLEIFLLDDAMWLYRQ